MLYTAVPHFHSMLNVLLFFSFACRQAGCEKWIMYSCLKTPTQPTHVHT